MVFINNSSYSLKVTYGETYLLEKGDSLKTEFRKDIESGIVKPDAKDKIRFRLSPFSRLTSVIDDQIKLIMHYDCRFKTDADQEIVFEDCRDECAENVICSSVCLTCSESKAETEYIKAEQNSGLIKKYKLIKMLVVDWVPLWIPGLILSVKHKNIIILCCSVVLMIIGIINGRKRKETLENISKNECSEALKIKSESLTKINESEDNGLAKKLILRWLNKY